MCGRFKAKFKTNLSEEEKEKIRKEKVGVRIHWINQWIKNTLLGRESKFRALSIYEYWNPAQYPLRFCKRAGKSIRPFITWIERSYDCKNNWHKMWAFFQSESSRQFSVRLSQNCVRKVIERNSYLFILAWCWKKVDKGTLYFVGIPINKSDDVPNHV